ncbi:MAG: hypothetical protein M3O50_12950 [Myxococcota bacterium]|nr:hypothetical protein [Myxococcota bacterium]
MTGHRQAQGGDLTILEEHTMVAVPRGDEELRLTFTRARTSAGKDIAWHSLRVFWKSAGGEWKPGKSGVTIRGRELHAVAQAFARAVSGAAQPAPGTPQAAQRPPGARAPQSREAASNPVPAPTLPWDGQGSDPDEGIF